MRGCLHFDETTLHKRVDEFLNMLAGHITSARNLRHCRRTVKDKKLQDGSHCDRDLLVSVQPFASLH